MKTFLLRFFLPPAYAVIIFLLPTFLTEGFQDNAWHWILIYLLYAYVFAGLPALGFAWVMRRFQRHGFRHGGIRLLTGAVLGLIAGIFITLPFGKEAALIMPPLGLVVGLLVELTVVLLEHRRTTRLT